MTNENNEYDFELPEVEVASKPRVHKGPDESTCTSCEG